MAYILKDGVFAVDGIDLSAELNALELSYSQELQDDTRFGTSARSRVPGLADAQGTVTGFFVGDTDTTAATNADFAGKGFDEITSTDAVMTWGHQGWTTGSVLHYLRGVQGEYNFGASVGDLLPLTLNFSGNGVVLRRGQSGFYSTATDGSTQGPGVTFGALTATQKLTLCGQVLRNTGTNITIKAVSSTAVGDFSLATTRLTLTAISGRGGQYGEVAGAITDTAFRVEITTTAAVSADIIVAFGVS